MYHSLFNHSPVEGHQGSFQFLANVNEAAAIEYCVGVCVCEREMILWDK